MPLAEVLYSLAEAAENVEGATGDIAWVTLNVSRYAFDRIAADPVLREERVGGPLAPVQLKVAGDGSALKRLSFCGGRVNVECPARKVARAHGGWDLV